MLLVLSRRLVWQDRTKKRKRNWLEDALQVLVSAKLRLGPPGGFPFVILVISGTKKAVVGGFMGIVIVPLWVVLV